MEEREKVVYANCADRLDDIAREAKRITLSNLKSENDKITAMCETSLQYLATERSGEEDEGKFEDVEGYFSEIKRSATLSLQLPKENEITRQYANKLRSYARDKATLIRETYLVDTRREDDWLDRMI